MAPSSLRARPLSGSRSTGLLGLATISIIMLLLLPISSTAATTNTLPDQQQHQQHWPFHLFLVDLLLSSAFLTAGFYHVKTDDLSPKRLAWLLSAFSSFITASLSLSALYQLFAQGWVIENVLFADDRLSRFTVTFFIAFLVLDLGFGLRYYPSQVQLLSGWVHHIFYLGVLAWALSSHFTLGFCLFLPLEIPTFILAVGSLYPQRRSDWLFGFTFFITRICYHLLLFLLVWEIKNPRLPIWIIVAVTFLLHIYWFVLWVKGISRKMREGGRKGGKGRGVAAAAAAAGGGGMEEVMGRGRRSCFEDEEGEEERTKRCVCMSREEGTTQQSKKVRKGRVSK